MQAAQHPLRVTGRQRTGDGCEHLRVRQNSSENAEAANWSSVQAYDTFSEDPGYAALTRPAGMSLLRVHMSFRIVQLAMVDIKLSQAGNSLAYALSAGSLTSTTSSGMCVCTKVPSSLQFLTTSRGSPSAVQWNCSPVRAWPSSSRQQPLETPVRSQSARPGRCTKSSLKVLSRPRSPAETPCYFVRHALLPHIAGVNRAAHYQADRMTGL